MAELNQLDNATHRFIRANNELQDFTFQKDPLISYARQNVREDYDGGRLIGVASAGDLSGRKRLTRAKRSAKRES